MSNSINIQVTKINSAFTLNYTVPDHNRCEYPNSSQHETVNYSQINDTKLRRCSVRGNRALQNFGNQTLPMSETSNDESFHSDDVYPEARRTEASRARNIGEYGNTKQRNHPSTHRSKVQKAPYYDRSSAEEALYSHHLSEESPYFTNRATAEDGPYSHRTSYLSRDASTRNYENYIHQNVHNHKVYQNDVWSPRTVRYT